MRRKNILFLVLFLIAGCLLFTLIPFQSCSQREFCHCVKIPVSFFPFSSNPLIKITIEKKQYTFLIDTGSSHALDLHKRVLTQIQGKEFIKITRYSDIQGTSYPVSQFRIPEVTLHNNLRLNGVVAYEENIDFLMKGTNAGRPRSFSGKIKEWLSLSLIDGRIGWPSFEQMVCLFDFPKAVLFLAKDRKTLQNEGLFVPEDFVRIPLALSRCGPVLSVQTEWGTKKFLLDTGASHSVYRESDSQSSNSIRFSMNIEGYDFGGWNFWPYPITSDLLNELDGVLGIDFFKTHVICFDFQEGHIYIRKTGEDAFLHIDP